ncbi:sulfite exporter TauE/SafE family protein [Pseudoxanthomonas sp. CAU 1598]|uniref:Probable membrane transporter protein n=1 Tax=Pseudomarimonas arenosa TaxID=2774145 RepID=A0AAW3ZM02_9GAMM|nr:sulfite exporter TauE/SafE family protein [Pseudomarimonas arenosa]
MLPAYLLMGALAGFLAGLLGIGGGLILVAALVWVLPQQGVPESAVMHVALATSLASIVFTGLSSARAHWKRGSILWRSGGRLIPGVVLGGLLGGQVAARLDGDWLRYGVAAFCVGAALQLLLGGPKVSDARREPLTAWLWPAGLLIGLISALVGIGGGSMTVPLLIALGATPVRAVGTSAACGVVIGLASALSYGWSAPADLAMPSGSLGYIYLPATLLIAMASVFAAPHGVSLAHRLPGAQLQRVFAALLLLVAWQLVFLR